MFSDSSIKVATRCILFQLSRAIGKKGKVQLHDCEDGFAMRMALPFHSVFHTDRDLQGCASLLKSISDPCIGIVAFGNEIAQ